MKKVFTKYKITVIKLKSRRGFQVPEDGIFLNDGDVLCGYSHMQHENNKYFDVWFNSNKNLDPDNYVTLGRIQKVEGFTYTTKLGIFNIIELSEAPNDYQ